MLSVAILNGRPEGPSRELFPVQDRLRLRDNFGFVLQQLRSRAGPFRALGKGPWAVFIGVATHLQLNAEAWPGQDTLACFSGLSVRAVRGCIAELEREGFLRLRRERRVDGSQRILYSPGPVMLRELAAFAGDFPKDRPKRLMPRYSQWAREADEPPRVEPPAPVAGTPAAPAAGEPTEKDQIKPSSSEPAPRPATTANLEEQESPEVTPDDADIARQALTERMQRKHPSRTPPRCFDATDLLLVAACSAALGGNTEAKLLAQRDALTGAFLASRDGPPTVRFIWGKLDHFLDHVERGRRRRVAEERNARMREAHDRPPQTAIPCPVATPGLSRAQVTADLQALFGPGWRNWAPLTSA